MVLRGLALLAMWLPCVVSGKTVDNIDVFLHRCITSSTHKSYPGPESSAVLSKFHCSPWKARGCCTNETAGQIGKDGKNSMYNIVLDQCPQKKNLSDKCRRHFVRDTCFYECSPNLAPWIVADANSEGQRKEHAKNVPLCASECDQWFLDCYDDYTCNDNWMMNWNWKKKGTPEMCTKPCKKFREYFKDNVEFCEKLFNYSYKYVSEKDGCLSMWPDSGLGVNTKVARDAAARILNSAGFSLVSSAATILAGVSITSLWL